MNRKQKKFLDGLFSNPLFDYLFQNEELIQNALVKDKEEDLTQLVAEDYFALLKRVHKGSKPTCVTLDANEPYIMIADGVVYDLDTLIRHNDTVNTERKMEIEALLADGVNITAVQKQLNQKIHEDW